MNVDSAESWTKSHPDRSMIDKLPTRLKAGGWICEIVSQEFYGREEKPGGCTVDHSQA